MKSLHFCTIFVILGCIYAKIDKKSEQHNNDCCYDAGNIWNGPCKKETEMNLLENTENLKTTASDTPSQDTLFYKISEPLQSDYTITITGTPTKDTWFTVNIGTGKYIEKYSPEIAVHFGVRFQYGHVVRNTKRDDIWGVEEVNELTSFPFKVNRPFKIEVLLLDVKTKWLVDGEPYCEYEHRTPSTFNATWIEVLGVRDATVKLYMAAELLTTEKTPSDILSRDTIYYKLPELVQVASIITITGTLITNTTQFTVNVGTAPYFMNNSPNIAVSYLVRFPYKEVVFNSKFNDVWGLETVRKPIPFKINRPFKIDVIVTGIQTVWTIDGKEYGNYDHRTPSTLDATWVEVIGVKDAVIKMYRNDKIMYPLPAEFPYRFEEVYLFKRDLTLHQIKEPLAIGSTITVTGTPAADVPRFTIQIGTDEYKYTISGQIAVRFDVHLQDQYVGRNSKPGYSWGVEETDADKPFPFKNHRPFRIEMLVAETKTIWSVDGEHYCDYNHRDPSPVNAIWIEVDGVTDTNIKIGKNDKISTTALTTAETTNDVLFHEITKPMSIGSMLTIFGTSSADISGFTVNIGTGKYIKKYSPEIAVHFDVRFQGGYDYVVRNTKRNDMWGGEEIQANISFPFKANHPFKIDMLVAATHTIWVVDGEHYCDYIHRTPSPFDANWVEVIGVRDAAVKIGKNDRIKYPTFVPVSTETLIDLYFLSRYNSFEELSEPLSVGTKVTVTGMTNRDLRGFTVNIGTGKYIKKNSPDIAVHFNARYSEVYASGHKVIRNTRRNNTWGTEEMEEYWFNVFPIYENRPFIIEMLVADTKTVWSIDGEFYCDYVHRSPSPLNATWIEVLNVIDGNLKVTTEKMAST